MKQIIIIVVLTIIFIGVAIFTNQYLKVSADEISGHMKNVENYAKKADWTSAVKELRLSQEKWNNVKGKWAILIDHIEVDNIDSSLSKVNGFMATKNLPNVLAESSNLREMVDHVPQLYVPNVKNIL